MKITLEYDGIEERDDAELAQNAWRLRYAITGIEDDLRAYIKNEVGDLKALFDREKVEWNESDADAMVSAVRALILQHTEEIRHLFE